jgi:hypothetical protein
VRLSPWGPWNGGGDELTDETNKPPNEANQPINLPPLPEAFTIPQALMEHWGEIPPTEHLNFSLTRQEIDHLLTGILRTTDAQVMLDRTFVEWSNGRIDEANRVLTEFRRFNILAQNNIRQFIASIMASVMRERKR